jgi:hypothetical protein
MPKANPLLDVEESDSPLTEPAAATHSQPAVAPETAPTAEGLQPPAPATPLASKPSLVTRLSADPSEYTSAPSIQVGRPMPLPKSVMASSKTGPGFSAQLKKTLSGTHRSPLDARQKKMAVLIGILSVVFGVVMFVSFGGVGASKAIAAENADPSAAAAGAAAHTNPQDWKIPQPLPADLRNATMPVIRHTPATQTGADASSTGEWVVKGIVFSKNKPSAIINTEIYTEGQRVNGAVITKITKESVEFELNGNRWTQPVKR